MIELLERDSFLSALSLMLNDALAGQGRIVLVSGEAGIGKTSLIENFTRTKKDTVRVLWGTCDSLFTPRPHGPLHDIALQTKGELVSLLASDADRQAIFSACFVELQNHPTIAVFEDIHWADEATLDLIKFLGRRIQRTPSFIILTYRDDELMPNHPLWYVLGDLPPAATDRLQLMPLSKSSVTALASAADQAERANELFITTKGNPFFVTEALASKDTGIPSTVRDAVLARAARLSPLARAVLEAAAVIGFHVEPWLLANIVGGKSANVEECIAGGMLQFQGDDYAFRHELARQVIFETISPERRFALHRMILSVLKKSPETRNDLARLANHAEGTKDVSAVLEYAPAAAQQAAAAGAHREAIELYELALRFTDNLPPAKQAQMLEAYTGELRFANRVAERVFALQKAIELWHSIGDRLREAVSLSTLAEAYVALGQTTESEEANRSALIMMEGLPPSAELAQVYMMQCFVGMAQRDCVEAVTWGEKAIALAEQFEDYETLARAHNFTGCAMLIMDYERGRELLERSLAIARKANLPWAIEGAYNNLGWMLVEVYHLDDAEYYLTEGLAYAAEHDDDYHLLQMLVWRALARLYQGHWEEALEIAVRVLQSRYVDIEGRTCALLALAQTRIRLGDPQATVALEEALALSVQANALPRLGPVRAARAEMAWLEGKHELAIEEARAAYDLAVQKKHPWIAGELAFWRWQAGDIFTPPAWIAKPFALQIAGDWRGAAEEWERRGCPYERAMALMDGDESAQLKALEIFESLGARPIIEKLKERMRVHGVRIPRGPRPETRENPFGLTQREMEVLGCLAKGQNNKAIAEHLSLSTRTVEHHIASIFRKMGIQSRVEAVAMAVKDNLRPSK
jgi:DNA-binding CsgD family transcriptional regulator/tetratricopeptide (TPR) repeat protein